MTFSCRRAHLRPNLCAFSGLRFEVITIDRLARSVMSS